MARRVLKKEDTVLLGEAVKALKEDKSEEAKFIDLAYKASHVWSMRHTERAYECFTDDIHVLIAQTKHAFDGIKGLIAVCVMIHDQFDDFQFEIHELISSGTLENGKICYRFTARGNWVKDILDTKAHGNAIDIDGAVFCTVTKGKISKKTLVINDGADPVFQGAMAKFTRMITEQNAH